MLFEKSDITYFGADSDNQDWRSLYGDDLFQFSGFNIYHLIITHSGLSQAPKTFYGYRVLDANHRVLETQPATLSFDDAREQGENVFMRWYVAHALFNARLEWYEALNRFGQMFPLTSRPIDYAIDTAITEHDLDTEYTVPVAAFDDFFQALGLTAPTAEELEKLRG